MKVTSKTTYQDLLTTLPFASVKLEDITDNIKGRSLPSNMDVNLNEMTFGALRRLQSEIIEPSDIFTKPFEIILSMNDSDYMKLKAVDALRFILKVKTSLEEITSLFNAIQSKPTEDEIKAGIDKISGGFFATADWYARRMGIANHDEVDYVQWGIIYLAKKKDFEEYQYQERYRKVVEQKHKRYGKG